jgi:hypothetical protein
MWESGDDILDFETSPEIRRASELLSRAGDQVAEDTLPLKKLEATCALKCFDKVRDLWSMSSSEKRSVMECVEKCEEPMERIADVLEDERNKMLETTTNCLERCREDDEVCAGKCLSSTLTTDRIDSMVERVRAKILAYKYS